MAITRGTSVGQLPKVVSGGTVGVGAGDGTVGAVGVLGLWVGRKPGRVRVLSDLTRS